MVLDLASSRGPEDLDPFDLFRFAQAEVKPEVVLRQIASSAADFLDLSAFLRGQANAGADGASIGKDPFQVQDDPVVPGLGSLPEQAGRLILIIDEHLRAPVVVDVSKSGSPGHAALPEPRTRFFGDVSEGFVAPVPIENGTVGVADVDLQPFPS